MRNWKNWLFPILTVLTVAALALLPLRLSTLEDGELTGAVHAEPLAADNNFPSKPPELPGRIWLLVQWQEMPENLTIMSQSLESGDRDRETRRLREALADLGTLLPPEAAALLAEVDGDFWDWSRYYLRDQADLSSASFVMASAYDKTRRVSLYATMDGESGRLVRLSFHCVDGIPCNASALELGEAVLDRLELEHVPEQEFDTSAFFRLPDCRSLFWIVKEWNELNFNFTLDWSAVDSETAEIYGRTGMDADSMQKW